MDLQQFRLEISSIYLPCKVRVFANLLHLVLHRIAEITTETDLVFVMTYPPSLRHTNISLHKVKQTIMLLDWSYLILAHLTCCFTITIFQS